jgi:flagellar hook-associated protein 1 FlgK
MGLTTAWNVATTSLASNASQTAVVSRNISGAQNSTGYVSAKVANLVTTASGSIVQSVANLTNATLFHSMLSSTAANASAAALSAGVTQLQQTVADATTTTSSTTAVTSPSGLLSNLSTALQTYSAAPSSTSAAMAVLNAAQNLASGLNSASATTQSVRETADQDMTTSVSTINSLLSQFQQVNTAIVNGQASGADISDALDQRDTILQSLSKQIGVTTTTNANNSMSVYTDSGVTLFDTTARSVTMTPTTTYAAGVTGASVYVDGVPVTGANAVMPIQSGALAGFANLRDNVATQYQSQLDSIAGGLINAFAETGQTTATSSSTLPGLFTYAGATAVPGANAPTGLAAEIATATAVDPNQGGNLNLLRDGGINGASYSVNSTSAASYSTLITSEITALGATRTFGSNTGLQTSNSVTGQAADSASWLDAAYQSATNDATYQSTLASQASTALSNATGVNLDAQMSHMLDLENSYQASAKLISTINSMFSSLLQAVA